VPDRIAEITTVMRGRNRSKNGVASLAYSRSKNGVASLAYSRSKNGVASLAYVPRIHDLLQGEKDVDGRDKPGQERARAASLRSPR
jgi:hypothetical protein